MLGGDVDDVVQAKAREVDACGHKRLRIHIPIHTACEQPPEDIRADVGRCENCFVGIRACAEIVIVIRKHTDLRLAVWQRAQG